MQNSFTDDSKPALIKDFKSLKTVKEKFKFWDNKLNQPYILLLFLTSPYYYYSRSFEESEAAFKLEDFIIIPNEDEFYDYNNLVYEEFKKYFDRRSVKIPLFDLEGMKKKYFEDLENAINKEIFIDYQVTQINETITQKKKDSKIIDEDKRAYFFTIGYERQYLSNQEPDLNTRMYDYVDLIYMINGNTLAKFQKWLISELDSIRSKPKEKKKEISLPQQILILHYLGVFEKINKHPTDDHKASFLASLLNKTPQSIREIYTYEIRTFLTPEERKKRKNIGKDLEKVHELFVSVGLEKEAEIVRAEKDSL